MPKLDQEGQEDGVERQRGEIHRCEPGKLTPMMTRRGKDETALGGGNAETIDREYENTSTGRYPSLSPKEYSRTARRHQPDEEINATNNEECYLSPAGEDEGPCGNDKGRQFTIQHRAMTFALRASAAQP